MLFLWWTGCNGGISQGKLPFIWYNCLLQEAPWESWLLLQSQESVLVMAMSFSTDLKGFSNTGSQISASVAPEGKSVVCVCLWGLPCVKCVCLEHGNSPCPSINRSRSRSPWCSCWTRMAWYHLSVVAANSQTQRFGRCSELCPWSSCTTRWAWTEWDCSQIHREPSLRSWFKAQNTSYHPVEAVSPSLPDEQLPSAKSSRSHGYLAPVCVGFGICHRRTRRRNQSVPEFWFPCSSVKLV